MSLYEVEKIGGKRFNEKIRKMQYKVKWKNYPQKQSTWQPECNLKFVRHLIQQFQKGGKALIEQEEIRQDLLNEQQLVGESCFNDSSDLNQVPLRQNQTDQVVKTRKRNIQQKVISKQQKKKRKRSKYSRSKNINDVINNQNQQLISQKHDQYLVNLENQDSKSVKCIKEFTDFQVIKMSVNENSFLFLVRDREDYRWTQRQQLLMTYKQQLIEFYEKHIVLLTKKNAQKNKKEELQATKQ